MLQRVEPTQDLTVKETLALSGNEPSFGCGSWEKHLFVDGEDPWRSGLNKTLIT